MDGRRKLTARYFNYYQFRKNEKNKNNEDL